MSGTTSAYPETELETLSESLLQKETDSENESKTTPKEHSNADKLASSSNTAQTYDDVSLKSNEAVNNAEFADSSAENINEDPRRTTIKKLMAAAQKGDLATLKELIESGNVDVNDHLEDNITALHWCAINNKLTALKYLVSKGAEVNHKGGDLDATPLHWACRYGLVYIAHYLICECKADTTLFDSQGFNCLHLSVHSSNIMMVIAILYFTDLHIDSTDPNGRTSLHWAAYQGDSLTVDVLIGMGANLGLVDDTGFIPLNWALVRPTKTILVKLLEKGSNLTHKTNDGKTIWDVAADMNCTNTLKTALKECGIKNDGTKLTSWLSERQGKIITFISPYFSLPLCLSVLSKDLFLIRVIIALIILGIQNAVLKAFVIPSYNREPTGLLKSPFFAGMFSATAAWCSISWMFTLLPATIGDESLSNFLFLIAATAVFASFFKAMFINPGYIPAETKREKIKATIQELIELRKFDSRNFCIYTSIRRPLRSKFSRVKNRIVAKFDHYCPWVYNDVAIRNHKLFFSFIVALTISILLYTKLALEYFDELDLPDEVQESCSLLSNDFCAGSLASPFIFNITLWCLFQFGWLAILVFVQCLQISKGLTSHEMRNLHMTQEESFSSVPTDEDVEDSNGELAVSKLKQFICLPACLINSRLFKLIGLHQLLILSDDLIQKKINVPASFDYGFKRNWLDFLFLRRAESDGYNLRTLFRLPLIGETNLNGRLVDYYKLYEAPVNQDSDHYTV